MKMHHELVRKYMWEYAFSVSYPLNMEPKQFLKDGHLEKMFNFLLKKGVVREEWRRPYTDAAKLQYQFWYMRNRDA